MFSLYHGNCLEVMNKIPDASLDMILCDLPYGTTGCKWDSVIDIHLLWNHYERLIKGNGAIVLFGDEPFSSMLRISKPKWYKYDWYWKKSRPAGFTNAKLKPLKDIETISVFSRGATANGSLRNMPYYPQGTVVSNIEWSRPKLYMEGDSGVNPARKTHKLNRVIEKTNYPRQILEFSNPNNGLIHPTQKPVDLLEYLIKTYTNEGELVMDNCMGSGSTGVACVNLNRNFIGIELDENFFNSAKKRIEYVENDSLCIF